MEANIGAPQVAYRETISHKIEHTYTHKKQSGGSGQFAEVKLEISPTEPGEGYFVRIPHRRRHRSPKEYIPGVEKGHQLCHGLPVLWQASRVIDFKVPALLDGKYHDVDSSVLAV